MDDQECTRLCAQSDVMRRDRIRATTSLDDVVSALGDLESIRDDATPES